MMKIFDRVGIKSRRTKNITKHVFLSFFYKGGSILASFLMVPLAMNYLNNENYGVWLTLSSFIALFTFFDIGLGHGLRNKFAESKAKGELYLAKAYVSSAYFAIGILSLILIIAFIFVNFYIDWAKVFNTNIFLKKELNILMPIVFVFFCLQLVLKLITTIYTADQRPSVQGKITFINQAGSLLFIWIITKTVDSSLLIFGIIISILPVLVLLIFNFYAFSKRYNNYRPTISLFKKKYLKTILSLGGSFFIIQISWVIINSTDNLIISQLFSPKEVVPYNIAFKLFSSSTMLFTIIATPYWSSFTEAYVKKDYEWIKKSMTNLKKISILFFGFSIFLLFFSNFLYKIWVGEKMIISIRLSALMGVYSSLIIYLTPLNYFINGVGKIKLQLYQTLIMAILNIPLSYFLAKTCGFGLNGIIMGTILCIIPGIILSSIQYYKIINQDAVGIWNK